MKDRSLILIDGVGVVVLISITAAVGWYAFAKPDTASSRVRAMSADVSQLSADFARLQTALDEQRTRYAELSASAEALGSLPSKSPIDQDLKQITALASDNRVDVLEVVPTAQIQYPNVLELQYNIKVAGRYADHIRFLQAFEACSFWADVTYLRFSQRARPVEGLEETRLGALTVSFYSAFQ